MNKEDYEKLIVKFIAMSKGKDIDLDTKKNYIATAWGFSNVAKLSFLEKICDKLLLQSGVDENEISRYHRRGFNIVISTLDEYGRI